MNKAWINEDEHTVVIIKQSDNYLELSILLYGNQYQDLWTIILQKA